MTAAGWSDRHLSTAALALYEADMRGDQTPREDRLQLETQLRARCPSRQAALLFCTLLVRDYFLADEALAASPARTVEDVPHLLGWLSPIRADPDGYDLPFCRACRNGPQEYARHPLHSGIGA
jgi:hypothetical protein